MYLEMTKLDEVSGFFDDGLAFLFKDEEGMPLDINPKHIHLEI